MNDIIKALDARAEERHKKLMLELLKVESKHDSIILLLDEFTKRLNIIGRFIDQTDVIEKLRNELNEYKDSKLKSEWTYLGVVEPSLDETSSPSPSQESQ
ncbi:MAG: hypothetical protein KGN01_07460 [Patescibacteria group bacterium]|nr:hypothetical protein [Patescibacteria group bacterium]